MPDWGMAHSVSSQCLTALIGTGAWSPVEEGLLCILLEPLVILIFTMDIV